MAGFLSGRVWWCALVISGTVSLAAPATAQTLTERLLDDARDGQLETFEFIAAALIAGGVEDECELSGWLNTYGERREQALAKTVRERPSERLQAIKADLHDRILTGDYQAEASDLRLTLTQGRFNCLSALAIYLDLCRTTNLNVEIWLARGHVYLLASDQKPAKIIEPGARGESRQRLHQDGGRRITPLELLGKFYYNRGVQALRTGAFAHGIELLQTSLVLDPADNDARANLIAGLNNWAVEHWQASRPRDAAMLIEQGLRMDPSFAPLIANQRLLRSSLDK